MSIKVACACGKAFAARESLAGKAVACPACGRPLQIPQASSLLDELEALEAQSLAGHAGLSSSVGGHSGGSPLGLASAKLRRDDNDGGKTLIIGAAAIAGGLVVCLVAWLTVRLMSEARPPQAETASVAPTPAPAAASPPSLPAPAATPTVPSPASEAPPVAASSTMLPASPESLADVRPSKKFELPSAQEARTETGWQDSPFNEREGGGFELLLANDDFHTTFAPFDSPIAVVGDALLNLKKRKKLAEVPWIKGRKASCVAVSRNGKYLAYQKEDRLRGDPPSLEIFDAVQSKTIAQIPLESLYEVVAARFLQDQTLAVVAGSIVKEARIGIWDLAANKFKHNYALGIETYDKQAPEISADGKYLVARTKRERAVNVYDLKNGKPQARLKPPADFTTHAGITLRSLTFSPDGQQIAGMCSQHGGDAHLLVWNNRGEVIVSRTLPGEVNAFGSERYEIQFVPDTDFLLLQGRFLFNRRLNQVVWTILTGFQDEPQRMYDSNTVVLRTNDYSQQRLVALPIPLAELERILATAEDADKVLLGPGQDISLVLELGDIEFANRAEVESTLRKSLIESLAVRGLGVADGEPIQLRVNYRELAGEQLQVVVQDGINRVATGQTVRDTVGFFEAKLEAANRVIWRSDNRRVVTRYMEESISDASVRDSMFKMVNYQVRQMQFPFLILRDEKLASLPLITSIEK